LHMDGGAIGQVLRLLESIGVGLLCYHHKTRNKLITPLF
jgi:hypothetical protein